MKVAAFIPSRFASTRLAGKPLVDICGKPMVQRVYERAAGSRLIDYIAVATDDARIYDAVISFGGKAVMTSVEHRSGTDRVAEAARGVDAGIIVNLQGDEPLMEPAMIDAAVRPLLEDPLIQMATLKTPMTEEEYHNPNAVKVVTDSEGFALYFSRSPIPYYRASFKDAPVRPYKHIGLYVYRKPFLEEFSKMAPTALETAESLEQLRALENGVRIKVVETGYNPISVDTPEDLERVRAIIGARER